MRFKFHARQTRVHSPVIFCTPRIQDRLKRAGAWWKLKDAERMAALRVCRANREWDSYWQSRGQHAA